MSDLRWDAQFAVGISSIDKQHRAMLDRVAKLLQLVTKGAPANRVIAAVCALGSLTAAHFREEERLMKRSGYDRSAVHEEHHAELLDQLERFAARYAARANGRESVKAAVFLRRWALHHILHADRELGAHLSSSR